MKYCVERSHRKSLGDVMYTVTKSRALGVSCQMVCKAVWQSYPRKYRHICCAENPSVLAR